MIWLQVDKEESKRLNIEEYHDNGWFLFIISGMVADVSTPTVNLQFYRKNVSDQEVGAVLVNNQAWEVYSAVQEKTANQARLLRIKDKTHQHNKLTKVLITEPYQTTSILAAEDQLKKVSREAVQVVSQDTGTKFHLDENGAVVLDKIITQPQGNDDMEQPGTVQEKESSDKRSVVSRTSVGSVASLTTGDVERRLLENNVNPTTDSVI